MAVVVDAVAAAVAGEAVDAAKVELPMLRRQPQTRTQLRMRHPHPPPRHRLAMPVNRRKEARADSISSRFPDARIKELE